MMLVNSSSMMKTEMMADNKKSIPIVPRYIYPLLPFFRKFMSQICDMHDQAGDMRR